MINTPFPAQRIEDLSARVRQLNATDAIVLQSLVSLGERVMALEILTAPTPPPAAPPPSVPVPPAFMFSSCGTTGISGPDQDACDSSCTLAAQSASPLPRPVLHNEHRPVLACSSFCIEPFLHVTDTGEAAVPATVLSSLVVYGGYQIATIVSAGEYLITATGGNGGHVGTGAQMGSPGRGAQAPSK